MAVDFASTVYLASHNLFARPVTFTPIKSQPTAAAYGGRGIYGTVPLDVMAEDGSILSDLKTILDILESEFSVLPMQQDQLTIPASQGLMALGTFEVSDVTTNGGGETTLTLRKLVTPKP